MIMKTGRRTDSDTLRRDIRDRDISRFSRKRPSMLSEFHGKHHNYRDSDRDGPDVSHYRSYNRYSYDGPSGVPSDYNNRSTFNPSTVSGGVHNKIKPDPRGGKRMYSPLASQFNYRTRSNYYHHSSHLRNDSDGTFEEDIPMKRPRLNVDVRHAPANLDPPNSADDSISSSTHMSGGHGTPNNIGSPTVSPPRSYLKGGGLSAYLEDIDSDDDDPLLREDVSIAKPTPSLNTREEPCCPGLRSPLKEEKKMAEDSSTKVVVVKPSKEELLQMMEKVDRDISALESQIVNLQKTQAELEEGAKTMPPSIVPTSTPSPKTPSPDITSEMDQGDQLREETPPTSPTPFADRQPSPKRTLAETIYAENKAKARSAQSQLQSLNFHPLPLHGIIPLYLQPSEAPCYHDNITSHRQFRPQLVEHLKRRKLSRHHTELSLCEKYDSLMANWERRVERIETNSKKKVRDMKNRELFERTFPELKARREQLERFTRVDQRGFGVVRSDAELNELMYELYNKEEAPARYRRTHAVIPPMLVDERDQRSKFISSNGHIDDVMAVHRDLKFCNIWTDEEKNTFREKFTLYPKNFDMISTFLPNKSPADCVKNYYLSKKSENFKQIVRKANLKRKKALIKPPELSFSTSSLNATPLSTPPLSIMGREKLKVAVPVVDQPLAEEEEEKIKSEFGDWTDDNISNLKEGLRKYGRAWGKVYREVGGSKTATQCKMFYDDYCTDERLGLQAALKEHSLMKIAEKQQRKSQTRKSFPAGDAKKKALSQQTNASSPLSVEPNDVDSENTESASESDTNAEESESESTITDSGPDDVMSEAVKVTFGITQPKQTRVRGGGKKSITSPPPSGKTSEDVVDLFLTAAEALKNNISPEVALHDHTYALPPSQLVSNMDLQGTSGLSLIAAAAAVVSPNLSRNAGSGKHPVMSPVRAPRGRPPNKYRGGGNNSASKLAPTLLSPAGSSANVLLTDIKTTAFRNRTRSAPTDRPKSSTLHIPRSGSTLARMSLSNSTGRGGSKGISVMPPASYSKQKSENSSSPSLKSMIALHPQQATGNTSAFEALVNVAVAAPPAELPKLSISMPTGRNSKKTSLGNRSSHSTPSPVSALSSKATLSRSNSNDCNNSSLSNGSSSGATATAYIDVSQAINILATLAQQTPGSSVGTSHAISVFQAQPLFAQTQALSASNLLESIVSQSSSKQSSSSTNTSSNGTSTASSISVTSNPASVSATVDTLLSHLTSGVNRSNSPTVRNASSPKPVGRPRKVPKVEGASRSSSTSISKSSSVSPSSNTGSNPQTSDDLSNLKLLSSLVAAVAATQSAPSMTTAHTHIDVSSHTSPPMPSTHIGGASSMKSSGEPVTSSIRSSYDSSSEIPITAHQCSNNCTPSPVSGHHPMSLVNSVSSSTISSAHSETPSPDDLPRSVVRPNPSAFPPISSQRSLHVDSLNSYPHTNSNIHESSPVILSGNAASTPLLNSFPPGCTAATTGDMTASLASIIPSYNPSMGQQSTLLLYTRSRSFPLSASSEPCPDEEDHLESATRGISELSKLLGTDGNGGGVETESPGLIKKTHETQISNYDNSSDFLSTPSTVSSTNGAPMSSLARAILNDFSTSSSSDNSSPPSKRNLSSLLESRGTVHHTALTGNSVGDSPGNHGDSLSNDTPLNVDTQSR